jgi:hypothetical protein
MSEETDLPEPVDDHSTKNETSPTSAPLPTSPKGERSKSPFLFFIIALFMGVLSLVIYFMKNNQEGITPIAFTPIALALWSLGQMVHAMRYKKAKDSITFYSHSEFFYYWPLWLVSFIFGDITLFFGSHVAVEGLSTSLLVMQETGYGLVYIMVLAFSLFATGVNLRGVWALLTMICLVFAAFLMLYFGIWETALSWVIQQPVYLNHGFYLAIGVMLFLPWCVVVFFFDTRKYVKIESNTVTIVHEIGEGARAYDTIGVMMEKKLDNFFKHYVLGFGSGDLVIRTSGGSAEVILLPNVLGVDKVLYELEYLRSKRGRI